MRKIIAIHAALLLAAALPARAADETVSNRNAPVTLGQVTVTAQKYEENVQEVPISISVVDGQRIEDAEVHSIRNVADYVPNMNIINNGMSAMWAPSIRGISAPVTALTVTAGMYVDGVPLTTAAGFEDSMLDIERIEVMRGPMGTIYGKNTEIGAINVITRQPDNEFRGKISLDGGKLMEVETGNGLKGELAAVVSGPLMRDKLYFGLAGRFYHRDGFMENINYHDTQDDREHWYGRAQLRWTPTEDWDISLSASRLDFDEGGYTLAMMGVPGFGPRQVNNDIRENNTSSMDMQSLRVKYQLGDTMSLTSVTAHSLFNHDTLSDMDGTPMAMMWSQMDSEYEKLSEELRFNYERDRLKLVAGLFIDDDENVSKYSMYLYDPVMGTYPSPIHRVVSGNAWAAFFNLTYPVLEKVNLVGGLRYERQESEMEDRLMGSSMEDSWNSLTPRFSVEYLLTPETMFYLTAAQGFRSGGFNNMGVETSFAARPDLRSYDEETLWNYELGMKSSFLDNRLLVNASVFYLDVSDMQVNTRMNPYDVFLTNVADASGFGAELEVTAQVAEGLTLLGSFGYTGLKLDDFSDAMGEYKDKDSPNAPRYTFNIGAQYRHPSGFFARADFIGYGKAYLDQENTFEIGSYQLFNAKVGWEFEKVDCYIYGNNIFNTQYDAPGYAGYYTVYSDPGEVGMKLVYRF